MADEKLKILYLKDLLMETDKDYTLNAREFCELMESRYGYSCDRRTIYTDIRRLMQYGVKNDDDIHFRAHVKVAVRHQFYGWVTAIGTGMEILSPADIRKEYTEPRISAEVCYLPRVSGDYPSQLRLRKT